MSLETPLDSVSRSSSPIMSPSAAPSSTPALDRSISTASTITSLSGVSSNASRPDATVTKRRGYMRPQATVFADSARNRDSVMSLGSIAHLQYYFARTGLLDGKGAQFAKEEEQIPKRSVSAAMFVKAPQLQQPPVALPQPKPRAVSESHERPRRPIVSPQQPAPSTITAPKILSPIPRKPIPVSKPKPIANPVKEHIAKPSPPPKPVGDPEPTPAPIIDESTYDPFNYTSYRLETGLKKTKSESSFEAVAIPAPIIIAETQSLEQSIPEEIVDDEQPSAESSFIEPDEDSAIDEIQPSEAAVSEITSATTYDMPAQPLTTGTTAPSIEPLQTDLPSISQNSFLSPTASIEPPPSPALSQADSTVEYVWEDELNPALTLPPTVSTYKQKSTYVPPPPNLAVLRRELREALEDARSLFKEIEADGQYLRQNEEKENDVPAEVQAVGGGWQQAQGLQVLDLSTLAIRAARNYYLSHEQPRRLYSIKSERQIRIELYSVLEVLKKMATRNFADGVRRSELKAVEGWMNEIRRLVDADEAKENEEHEERQKREWLDGEWTGRERERELLFLRTFDHAPNRLPEWRSQGDSAEPSPFLATMRSGLRLVQLHNELVRQSTRHFEEIKNFHTDTAKPYRCAENLRFWIKAAELRWDALLDVDVSSIANGGSSAPAWAAFDAAILRWSQAVRTQIVKEWKEHRDTLNMEKPILRMDPAADQQGLLGPVPW